MFVWVFAFFKGKSVGLFDMGREVYSLKEGDVFDICSIKYYNIPFFVSIGIQNSDMPVILNPSSLFLHVSICYLYMSAEVTLKSFYNMLCRKKQLKMSDLKKPE